MLPIDPTTTLLIKLPDSLKQQLDTYAGTNHKSTSYVVRLAICNLLDLPPTQAEMQGNKKYEDGSLQGKRERENITRRQARFVMKRLASVAPEVLTTILEGE